jgi:hypothetical protein
MAKTHEARIEAAEKALNAACSCRGQIRLSTEKRRAWPNVCGFCGREPQVLILKDPYEVSE